MSKIFGANFRALQIAGLMVLAALLFVGIWKLIERLVPDKQPTVTTKEVLQVMQPRWKYEDSISLVKQQQQLDSLRYYSNQSRKNDSILLNFYQKNNERNEKYNRIYNADERELMQQWAARYGK
ncbi:MAG: hypothetical protein JSS64_08495 [Bacteroidetes bacterium]|nr:hypothetical protein [Bacteroidota bacterium]